VNHQEITKAIKPFYRNEFNGFGREDIAYASVFELYS